MATISKPLIIAHRGASGSFLENTFESFKKAVEVGADVIELDVHKCKSGQVVVMHDETIDRTTDGQGNVVDLTLEELKKVKTNNNEAIPTLPEALDCFDKKTIVDIELKGANAWRSVAHIIDSFVEKKGWGYSDFVVSSFDHEQLILLHQMCPRVPIGYLTTKKPNNFEFFNSPMQASILVIDFTDVTKELVDVVHQMHKKIWVYTVNNKDDFERMKNMGVDGIATDYPELFSEKYT